jgi:hypothetical protein
MHAGLEEAAVLERFDRVERLLQYGLIRMADRPLAEIGQWLAEERSETALADRAALHAKEHQRLAKEHERRRTALEDGTGLEAEIHALSEWHDDAELLANLKRACSTRAGRAQLHAHGLLHASELDALRVVTSDRQTTRAALRPPKAGVSEGSSGGGDGGDGEIQSADEDALAAQTAADEMYARADAEIDANGTAKAPGLIAGVGNPAVSLFQKLCNDHAKAGAQSAEAMLLQRISIHAQRSTSNPPPPILPGRGRQEQEMRRGAVITDLPRHDELIHTLTLRAQHRQLTYIVKKLFEHEHWSGKLWPADGDGSRHEAMATATATAFDAPSNRLAGDVVVEDEHGGLGGGLYRCLAPRVCAVDGLPELLTDEHLAELRKQRVVVVDGPLPEWAIKHAAQEMQVLQLGGESREMTVCSKIAFVLLQQLP